MKALLRLAGWATLMFVLAWGIAHPYQRIIGDLAGRIAAPAGTQIEWVDLEVFFPYDMSVFVALCLASNWVNWRTRFRTAAMGLGIMLVIQILTLVVVMKVLLASAGQPADQADATLRLVVGVIRLTGLVAAACAWAYWLGWQRLPQLADSLAARSRAPRGGKR